MKVIALSNTRMNENLYKTLFIETIKKHYDITIWEISYWCKKEIKIDYCFIYEMINKYHVNIIPIKTTREFEANLQELNGSQKNIMISLTDMSGYFQIYNIIKRYNILFACINSEAVGIQMRNTSIANHLSMVPVKDRLKNFAKRNKTLRKIIHCFKFKNIKYDFSLMPKDYFPETREYFIPFHYSSVTEEFIKAFNNDFDEDKKIKGDYAVYVDTALIVHPGYKTIGHEIDPGTYFKYINRYFDNFERIHKLKVIIAAYPKVKYMPGDFGGREIIYGKTADLIKNARIVLAHYSSALANAILLRKPIIFLYYKELFNDITWIDGCGILERAEELGQPCDDISENKCSNVVDVNKEAYDLFVKKWILSSSVKDKTNEELIVQFLKDIERGVF